MLSSLINSFIRLKVDTCKLCAYWKSIFGQFYAGDAVRVVKEMEYSCSVQLNTVFGEFRRTDSFHTFYLFFYGEP